MIIKRKERKSIRNIKHLHGFIITTTTDELNIQSQRKEDGGILMRGKDLINLCNMRIILKQISILLVRPKIFMNYIPYHYANQIIFSTRDQYSLISCPRNRVNLILYVNNKSKQYVMTLQNLDSFLARSDIQCHIYNLIHIIDICKRRIVPPLR